MKAMLTGKITIIEPLTTLDGTFVRVTAEMKGKIEDTKHTAKEIETTLQLKVKPLAAESMAYGDDITIELTTSRPTR